MNERQRSDYLYRADLFFGRLGLWMYGHVDALPVNATGKVLKQQLRQQLKDEQAKF
jgi:hypothetical protein